MEEAAAPAAQRRGKAAAAGEQNAATSDGQPVAEIQGGRMLRSAGATGSQSHDTTDFSAAEVGAAPAPTWQQYPGSPAKRAHMTPEEIGKENIGEVATCGGLAQLQRSGPAACGLGGNPDGPASPAAALPPGNSLLRRLLLNTRSSAQLPTPPGTTPANRYPQSDHP